MDEVYKPVIELPEPVTDEVLKEFYWDSEMATLRQYIENPELKLPERKSL